ncbi:hypothetical protein [Pontibacter chitinilyticus]|uniref:hypothetical protein n=1 Tax=Pontibacter chitinilyticus TaxID=2674989 RepID=UPI0032191176
MKKYKIQAAALVLLGFTGCTSLSEGQVAAPAADLNRRVSVPENASGLREHMDEQASEINRKRNIEQFDENLPAMTPTKLRPQRVPFSPADTVTHEAPQPLNTTVPPVE